MRLIDGIGKVITELLEDGLDSLVFFGSYELSDDAFKPRRGL
jgi:hypothetical protein